MKFDQDFRSNIFLGFAAIGVAFFSYSLFLYMGVYPFTDNRGQLAATGAAGSCANWSAATPASALYFPARGVFYLPDSDKSGYVTEVFFGPQKSTLTGLAGDWNKSGFSSIGYYDPSTATFALKYRAVSGPADVSFVFGRVDPAAMVAFSGDWDGDGVFTVGLYDKKEGKFYIKNANTAQSNPIILTIPGVPAGATPIVGDWMGDGITRVGLHNKTNNTFYLRDTNDPENTRRITSFIYMMPNPNWKLVVGRWDANTKADGIGFQTGTIIIPRRGETQYLTPQGFQGAEPVVLSGKWMPSRCLQGAENTTPRSPSWAKDMIFYHVRIETFTPERTFKAATERLTYVRDLGVTGVVLTPIATLDSTHVDLRQQVFYGPSRPDILDPRLGTDADFKAFVAEAHRLGMKVFVDNVVHGIKPESPYVPKAVEGIDYKTAFVKSPAALPEDFFNRTAAGLIRKSNWGTAQWDWSSSALRAWWSNNIAVAWVQKYNVDGFRIDLEPNIAGSALWYKVRADVLAKTGKEIALMSELRANTRGYTFDFTQTGFGPKEFYDGGKNLVDFVKSSKETFETAFISNHDKADYTIKGRLGAFAYAAILSPLVPYWMVGEEFNATRSFVPTPGGYGNNLYFAQQNWAEAENAENKAFLEKVKKLVQIRKQYKDIIAPLDRPLNQVNIAKVTQYSGTDLEPYIMWNGTAAILVAAKRGAAGDIALSIPTTEIGMSRANNFKITNLMTGEEMSKTLQEVLQKISFPVEKDGVLVLKIEGQTFAAKPADVLTGVLDNIPGLTPNVHGYVDGVIERDGSRKLNGWACMLGKNTSISVHVYLNSPTGEKVFFTGVKADMQSEDGVARACSASGTNYRFSIPITEDTMKKFGGYGIDVHGISTLGLANWKLTDPKKTTIPAVAVPVLPPNRNAGHGYLDGANCRNFTGWAIDMDVPSESVSVEVKEGIRSIGIYTANAESADVNRVISVTGAHRFVIPVPQDLKDGQEHSINVYALDSVTKTRTELRFSPKTITCTQ